MRPMGTGLHYGPGPARACPVDDRGLPAPRRRQYEPRRSARPAGRFGVRFQAASCGWRALQAGRHRLMFLLDTNVISELRRPERANTNVIAWANTIPAASSFLSAISILEIVLGTLQIARRDAAQDAVLRAWIDDQILPRFEGRIGTRAHGGDAQRVGFRAHRGRRPRPVRSPAKPEAIAYFLDCGVTAPRTLPQGSALAFLSGILLSPDL